MKKGWRIAIGVLVAILVLFGASWLLRFGGGVPPAWGVTFSEYYAKEELKLDWRATYRAILDDLKPAQVRLVAYWQYLEPAPDTFDFTDLDWQMQEAAARGAKVILVVGQRVPRWPECHWPSWVKTYPTAEFQEATLNYLGAVVARYKDSPALATWQVENEPFFPFFGVCPPGDRSFLEKEIALVKKADPAHPIMTTVSGELSLWGKTAGLTDLLGTTLYRIAWNKYTGWWKHFFPPALYTARAWAVKTFWGTKEVIISELQAEPWASDNRSIVAIPFDEQTSHFNLATFEGNVRFAEDTGLHDIYLWGAEWWYWRRARGDSSFWDAARELLKH